MVPGGQGHAQDTVALIVRPRRPVASMVKLPPELVIVAGVAGPEAAGPAGPGR